MSAPKFSRPLASSHDITHALYQRACLLVPVRYVVNIKLANTYSLFAASTKYDN